MPRKKRPKLSRVQALTEWMGWINSTNATLLAKAFEDWMKEQGYVLCEKEKCNGK